MVVRGSSVSEFIPHCEGVDEKVVRMPGFAYLLMSHGDPAGLESRVRRIRVLSPGATVAVRWTRPGFLDVQALERAGALVLPSDVTVRWGDWTLTWALLEALHTLRTRVDPAYTVVLSGQDHPVRDLADWEREVSGTGTDALLWPDDRDHSRRWRRCWHTLPSPTLALAGPMGRLAERARSPIRVSRAGGRTPMADHARRGGAPVPYRKGSFWSTLSRDAVRALLEAGDDPRVGGFFATTLLPDEAFAHSVVHAAPGLVTTRGRTSFTVFDRATDAHPRELGADDVAAALDSGAPFARKVTGPDSAFARAADARLAAERAGRAGRAGLRPPASARPRSGPGSW